MHDDDNSAPLRSYHLPLAGLPNYYFVERSSSVDPNFWFKNTTTTNYIQKSRRKIIIINTMTSKNKHDNQNETQNEDERETENETIPRPNNSSFLLVGPSSQLRAPSSLLSGALPPSLLQEGEEETINININNNNNSSGGVGGVPSSSPSSSPSLLLNSNNNNNNNSIIAMRPRRLWSVQDTAPKRIPQGYPPLNPQCTTYVGDASPSVVAVRISECLRKRSIAVEYDDETVIATALTVDRCLFQVQLYKGDPELFSHGVVVECMRISGNVISFHTACRAILQAALGQSTGDDTDRPLHHCNGREFQRLPDKFMSSSSSMTTLEHNARSAKSAFWAAQALEQAKELIHKDRLDTQVLGMERLVDLTTPSICGSEIALSTSLQLVEQDPQWLVHRVMIDDELEGDLSTFGAALRTMNSNNNNNNNNTNIHSTTISDAEITSDEGRLASQARALALRVLCNAVSNLSEANKLSTILNHNSNHASTTAREDHGPHDYDHHPLTEKPFLDSLVEDLKGVNRPPSIVQAGTNTLASVHEAAIAVRILRILGEHSANVQEFLGSEVVLERLEVARTCGRATHIVLQQEAERTYAKLTEDIRSC